MVGSREGVLNFTALGDEVNVGAHIAFAVEPGELLASIEACQSTGVSTEMFQHRDLDLIGKSERKKVVVLPSDWNRSND
jgi:hypothetical protein